MDRFDVVRQLGKGAHGRVALVRRKSDGREFAMKSVPLPVKRQARHRCLREARLMCALHHPHVIECEDVFFHHGRLCVVLGHCAGGDLRNFLERRRKRGEGLLPESIVIQVVSQLASALDYLHSKGAGHKRILHRDVKAENIFLVPVAADDARPSAGDHAAVVSTGGAADGGPRFDVVLGDFGISRVLETCQVARTDCGTPSNMAPEVFFGQGYNDRADVWALGCTVYELMTCGRQPFTGRSLLDLAENVCGSEPPPLPDAALKIGRAHV